jgi:hypothetical protein
VDPGAGYLSDVLLDEFSRLKDDLSRNGFHFVEHRRS